MSVIIDAIEAAKRARARRESPGVLSSVAPVLVPLRSRPARRGGLRRTIPVVGGVAVIAIAGAAFAALSPSRTALPAVPALTSTILAEALAADSARRTEKVAPVAQAPVPGSADHLAAPSARPSQPQTTGTAVASPPPIARQQVAAGAPEVRQAGRLRVAIEQPVQPEAARLFADAVAAQRAGDAASARRLYESVLSLNPGDADALNNLGVLESAQRNYPRALDLLRRGANISPRNPGIWNNIGTVLREQGKNNDAIAAFRQALSIDPQHPAAKVGLAQQFLAINALADARRLLEEVVAAHPMLPEAEYSLGQVLELQGDRAGAIRAYGAFVSSAPARLASHVELVRRRIESLSR